MNIGNITLQNNVFLAPMAGVSDMPFREIIKDMGCGLTYSEMVSCKGLFYNSKNTKVLLEKSPNEVPFAVQIFGNEPELMGDVAAGIDCDIIDINMGCPAPKIVRNNEGSALLKNPPLVGKIVKEVVARANKPVTVKIRKGFTKEAVNAVEIAKIIEANGALAICLHGRTTSEQYGGIADWDIIRLVKEAVNIPVIGNGDVTTPKKAKELLDATGCDAVMVGRGTFGNPFLIREIVHFLKTGELLEAPSLEEIVKTALYHSKKLIALKGEFIAVAEMRKHIGWYTKGMVGGSAIRREINAVKTPQEIEDILNRLVEMNKNHF